jgi:poly(A) polymerase
MSPDLNRPFAESVVRTLREAGHQALFAGGCVRDLLLGTLPKDYDVATDARPERVREVFGHRRTLAVGASFGVIVVLPSKAERDAGVEPVEVATFRTEGPYLDGRRPERVEFATPEEDAKRRDFTINGMFLDPVEDRVLDFVGGQTDLRAGVIRAIGDPRERMAEDKLRLLRAVRFAATLGFRLDEGTAAAVREMAGQLTVVSAERIVQELRRMLVHPNRRRAVELCAECGLLERVFPELGSLLRSAAATDDVWNRTLSMLERLDKPSFPLALACLLHGLCDAPPWPVDPLACLGVIDPICGRLRLSNAESVRVIFLVGHQNALDGIRRDRPSRMKRLCATKGARDLVELVRVRDSARGESLDDVRFVENFLRSTPPDVINPPMLLTGDDLIALGLKPGPTFKRLLDDVRNAQLDGTIESHEEAIALARRLHGGGAADTT